MDVMAYLALLRELKKYNNGDLSLTLTRAKRYGINSPKTLARSLRALQAVGLIACTRKGGCTKGGQRLPSLYRVTDRECNELPLKCVEAMPATNEWKRVKSREQGLALIEAADSAATAAGKLKGGACGVPKTKASDAAVKIEKTVRDIEQEIEPA